MPKSPLNFAMKPVSSYFDFARSNPAAMMALGGGLMSGDMGRGLAQFGQYAQIAQMQRQQQQQQAEQRNRTLEYLQSRRPELAAMVEAGMPVAEAWRQALAPAPDRQVMQDAAGRQRYVDDGSYVFADVGADPKATADATKDSFDFESRISKDYRTEDDVKAYRAVRTGYEKVRAAAQTDSGPGDVSLLFGFMKMIDPGSVVRESEFATAENAGGVSNKVRNLYNRAITGERLTPELRAQFVKSAEGIYAETVGNLEDVNRVYSDRAGRYDIDPGFLAQPEQYEPLDLGRMKVGERVQRGDIVIEKLSD